MSEKAVRSPVRDILFRLVLVTLASLIIAVNMKSFVQAGDLFPGGVFSKRLYRLLYLGAAFLGSVMRLEAVWNLSDLFNALMAVPNLLAVLALSDMVAAATEEYFGARRPASKRNKRRGKKLRQG